MTVHISRGTSADIPAAARLLAEALGEDAVLVALVPGEHDRLDRVTEFYIAVLRLLMRDGVLDVARLTPEGPIVGVASWEVPGQRASTWERFKQFPRYLRSIGPRHLSSSLRLSRYISGPRPDFAHWHLSDIGVGEDARGHGVGSALLRHRLELVTGHPAYLEATTPQSQRLYERFGFEVIAPIKLTADGYPMAMLRRAETPDAPPA